MNTADAMRRISAHLDGLAAEAHALEQIVGSGLGPELSTETQSITQLQRLDFLRQSLEDVALLCLLLSDDCAGIVNQETVQRVRLESTRALLLGTSTKAIAITAPINSGDLDLF
ncbi:MAG: hypothetical protein AAF509_16990 [Pseudomonadota bacterium]